MASRTAVDPETPGRGPQDAEATPSGAVPASPSAPTPPEPTPPDAAPTELAALEAARDEKRQLLEQAAAAAGEPPALPAGCTAADLPALLQRYYWSEPADEVLGHPPTELADLAVGHLRLAGVRAQGSATVDVTSAPDGQGRGAGGGRAIVRIVTDDMPFPVDSVTAEVGPPG